MNIVFALGALVALVSTVMVITRKEAVHALLYLVVSLLAVALLMLLLGAAFVAALEVIIYARAIMVLFVFVIMMIGAERISFAPRAWIGPAILSAVLLAELVWVLVAGTGAGQPPGAAQPLGAAQPATEVGPKQVGMALFGPYLLGAETAAFLLLAGLVGAFHLGRRRE